MSTRATRDLLPGDTVRGAGPTVRTVLENIHPRPESRWHVLRWRDGTSFWSEADDVWELHEPSTLQADAWDQGYAAGRADTAAEQPNVSRPPHLYARNPYRA